MALFKSGSDDGNRSRLGSIRNNCYTPFVALKATPAKYCEVPTDAKGEDEPFLWGQDKFGAT